MWKQCKKYQAWPRCRPEFGRASIKLFTRGVRCVIFFSSGKVGYVCSIKSPRDEAVSSAIVMSCVSERINPWRRVSACAYDTLVLLTTSVHTLNRSPKPWVTENWIISTRVVSPTRKVTQPVSQKLNTPPREIRDWLIGLIQEQKPTRITEVLVSGQLERNCLPEIFVLYFSVDPICGVDYSSGMVWCGMGGVLFGSPPFILQPGTLWCTLVQRD